MLDFQPAPQDTHASHALQRKVLVIDNYDSFTFNLVQSLCEAGAHCLVCRNDELGVEGLLDLDCDGVLISPGPARPENAGACLELIQRAPQEVPLLGVCLGHQAIAQAFGGRVQRAAKALHGKQCRVEHDATGLFAGLPTPLTQARYNSLTVDPRSLPSCLRPTAWADGEIMALTHVERPLYGVQFHPESHLSELGSKLLHNWLQSLC